MPVPETPTRQAQLRVHRVTTAILLAGGQGERLRPLTANRPKPMVLLLGRPLLEHQIVWLASQGISRFVIACGYRADVIQHHFGDGHSFGVSIHYSVEAEPLGRGGALKLAARLLPPETELVIAANGDNLTNQPLAPLIAYHRRRGSLATMVVTRLVSPFGITTLNRRADVVGFVEKPVLPYWLNAGLYCFSRAFFNRLPDRGDHETTTFPVLAAEGLLSAYRSRAYWRTVDTVKDLSEAERELGDR
jgi:NDP-sugar pyrophosphorylase family protein